MTPLSKKMLDLAASGHPRADELRVKAQELNLHADNPNLKKMLGAWARARRVWSECSGEPLI